jgi:dipeptidyl aminopeptidase/acylaminoacyl peptidase
VTANAITENLWRRYPRYMAAGFDPNDFQRAIEGVESWDDWLDAVTRFADERIRLGEEALAAGRRLSAGEYLCEGGIYLHLGQLAYFTNEEKKLATKLRSIATYRRGLGLLQPPITRLEIPFRGVDLVAHLRRPADSGPLPVVMLLPGVDSSKEEYHVFSEVFLRRGLATLVLEGPGQGETWFAMKMIDDYEKALSAVIDFLGTLPLIDTNRVAVYGRSMGGYLAPRAAAFEPRLKAVVSAGGIYDLSYWQRLPESVRHNFRHAWGLDNMDEAAERAKSVSLAGLVDRISCPLLLVHTGRDTVFPKAGAERMKAEATGPAELVIYDEGTHVADNIRYKYQRFVADWLARRLAAEEAAT